MPQSILQYKKGQKKVCRTADEQKDMYPSRDIMAQVIKNFASEEDPKAGEKAFRKTFKPFYDFPPIDTAARLLRFLAVDFHRFVTVVEEACKTPGIWPKNVCPLVFPVVGTNTLGNPSVKYRVFTNIQVRLYNQEHNYKISVQELENTTWFMNVENIQPTMDVILADLKSLKKKQKWNPANRAIKQFKRSQTLSIGKFLQKYTSVKFSSAELRDVGAAIDENFLPVRVEEADTFAKLAAMYDQGPTSCMSGGSDYGRDWAAIHKKLKEKPQKGMKSFHPAHFYYYDPNIKGFFLKQKGKITARCIAYQYGKPVGWHYSKIYSSNTQAKKKMLQFFADNGFRAHSTTYTVKEPFSIPGLKISPKDFVMPLPYIDGGFDMHVRFNKEKEEFEVQAPGKGKLKLLARSTKGYTYSSQLVISLCKACGETIREGRELRTRDGHVFCGITHAQHSGYVDALQSDGVSVWARENEVVRDPLDPQIAFTGLNALRAAPECMPILTSSGVPEDGDENYSVSGHKVTYQKVKYRIDRSFYKVLKHLSLMNSRNTISELPVGGAPVNTTFVKGEFRIYRDETDVA